MSALLAAFAIAQAIAPSVPTPPVVVPVSSAATAPVDPVRLAAAKKLIAMVKLERTFDLMFVQLAPNFAHAVIGKMATEDATKDIITELTRRAPENRDKMVAILSQEFLQSVQKRYPLLLNHAAEEYAAAFTTEELNAISDFYASGPGAKALAMIPQLQAKMSAYGQSLGRDAGAEAGQRAFERIAREMLPEAQGKKS